MSDKNTNKIKIIKWIVFLALSGLCFVHVIFIPVVILYLLILQMLDDDGNGYESIDL